MGTSSVRFRQPALWSCVREARKRTATPRTPVQIRSGPPTTPPPRRRETTTRQRPLSAAVERLPRKEKDVGSTPTEGSTNRTGPTGTVSDTSTPRTRLGQPKPTTMTIDTEQARYARLRRDYVAARRAVEIAHTDAHHNPTPATAARLRTADTAYRDAVAAYATTVWGLHDLRARSQRLHAHPPTPGPESFVETHTDLNQALTAAARQVAA